MLSRLRSFFPLKTFQRRSFGIVFFVFALLILSHIAEYATLSYYNKNWDTVVETKSAGQLQAVRTAFTGVQRKVRRIASELARHPDITDYLTGKALDLSLVFDQAGRISRNQDVSAEVYDRTGTLIAWQGRSGFVRKEEIQKALQGVLTSYVNRGPIYSHLFVISPVRVKAEIVGATIVRQAVEVNYPLSNKFITRAGLAQQLSTELDATVEINYGENAEPRKDGRYVSTDLHGIDGRKLGVANILRLSRTSFLENVSETFHRINAMLSLILFVVVGLIITKRLANVQSFLWQAVFVTLSIWLGRYVLLWLDIPSVFFHKGIFDPNFFASKFGGGVAKTIGEMTLTSVVLFANTTIVTWLVLRKGFARRQIQFRGGLVSRILFAVGTTVFLFFLLHGYAAIIRSAVFDSTLRYNDLRIIIPPMEVGVMLFNLFVITLCLIVVSVVLTRVLYSLFQTMERFSRGMSSWFVVATLYGIVALLFNSPLISTVVRLTWAVVLVLFSFHVYGRERLNRSPFSFANAVIVLVLCALLFYPLLDGVIHQKDRDRAEVFAREVLRPVDAWLKFVVEESLQSFVSDETYDMLMNGDGEEINRLAFSCWAHSSAAQQGYNCLFIVFDSGKKELNRFAIGEQNEAMMLASEAALNGTKPVEIREAGSGVNAMKIYSASIPIIASDRLLGYGVVVVSAAQQSLFRGESPTVFRTVSGEDIESFYRPIIVNEFHRTELFTTSSLSLPVGYRMPETVARVFSDSLVHSRWTEENIGDKSYETFYIRREPGSDRVISLSVEMFDLLWHLFGIGRTFVYFAVVLVVGICVALLFQLLQRKPVRFTFRSKLLTAFLITATIPVIVIAMYSRVFARERLREHLSERLGDEIAEIEETLQQNKTQDSLVVHRNGHTAAERIAAKIKADFNLYVDNVLQMSSRPELYETGILDRRMSGAAYSDVITKGRRFHLEAENIGLYRYAVGYRPVVDEHGKITAVISVPTLYRQEEISEEIARINAVLFGISAVILIAISLIATAFANRIAAPIQKLIEATKRVSLGDLDVRVNAHADGEIGELIRSFETMTKDLKNSRENLVQFERELAWKEMAKQVAHEIKNPLTPMKLALQHLRQTYRDKVENFDEIFEEVSQMVIRQVDALSRIASEFSSFARMPRAQLEKCSVNDILREAVSLFEQENRIVFEINFASLLPPVKADREELRRAFINILRNAIQAMNGEGRIIISTATPGDDIEIRIQDFGTGIPDEVKGKLFQPNFSTKTDGMGLGLAIVKKTVEDLGGTISIESKVGEGTTVIMTIPVHTEVHESVTHSKS